MLRFATLSQSLARHRLALTAVLLSLFGASPAALATSGSGPVIEPARTGQCVGDPAFMRRNHMQLLKHQRSDTLRGGIRTGQYSLKACIDCHASQSTNSVSASDTGFCQSCHLYAAVKLDCFECHSSKPQVSKP